MWKYKKAILSGIAIGLLNAFYVLLNIGDETKTMWTASQIVFLDYTYHFFFSFFLFSLIYTSRNHDLELYKFKTLAAYRKYQLLWHWQSLSICFLIMTPIQVLVYHFFSTDAVLILLMRNSLFFCFICFTAYLYEQMPFKYKNIGIVCLYLFWNFEMILLLVLSDTWLGNFNVFIILKSMSIIRVLKYISCGIAIIAFVRLVGEGDKKQWLD